MRQILRHACRGVQQESERNACGNGLEYPEVLFPPVFKHTKIIGLKSSDGLPFGIFYRHIDFHHSDIDSDLCKQKGWQEAAGQDPSPLQHQRFSNTPANVERSIDLIA